jgi:DNA modification methylase
VSEAFEIYRGDAYKLLESFVAGGVKVDHIITDPPYNISKANNLSTLKNSKRVGVDFGKWDKDFDLTGWISNASKLLNPGGSFIVFNSYRNLSHIIEAMEEAGLVVKDVIRWTKSNPMPRNILRRYVQDTEYAIWAVSPKKPWVFNKPPQMPYLRAEFNSSTVSGHEKTTHPTQKSLKVMQELILVHTNENDKVLDPFMGSGTTGVAAKLTGRRFVGFELEKQYFKLAEKRLLQAVNDNKNA